MSWWLWAVILFNQRKNLCIQGSFYFQNDSLSSPIPSSKDNGFSHNILPEPIGKGRSNSMSSSFGGMAEYLAAHGKAPGSEREDAQVSCSTIFKIGGYFYFSVETFGVCHSF